MTVEISYIIAVINCILGVAVFYFARKKDSGEVAKEAAEIAVEMRAIRREMSEVKVEVNAMRKEWREDHDAIQRLIHETKAMWRVIDALKKGEE